MFQAFTALIVLFAFTEATAQKYRSIIYQTEDGLPTNLTKGLVEDEQGFLWIATDAGIIRYDGREFISYADGLGSSYPKGILKTSDGSLLVYHDDGISRINDHNSQRVQLETILQGAGNPGPATVNYPKALYEDHEGKIWISEVYSVARYDRETAGLKRYFLPDQYRTSSFVRSFEFQETPQQLLLLSSQQGYLFYFDAQQQEFVPIPNLPDVGTINTMMPEPQTGAVWLGTANGIIALYEQEQASPDSSPVFRFERISDRSGISKLERDAGGNIWAGGWNTSETGVLIFSTSSDGSWRSTELDDFGLNSVNDIFVSEQGQVWIATDEGLALYYPGFFTRIPVEQQRKYVQSITAKPIDETAESPEPITYYMTDASRVYEIQMDGSDSYRTRVRFNNPEMDDLLSVSASDEGIWMTSSRGQIYFMAHGAEPEDYRVLTVQTEDNSIFYSLSDSLNRLWYLSYNKAAIKRMTPDGELREYREQLGVKHPVSILRMVRRPEKEEMDIYAASSNRLELLRYNADADRFDTLEWSETQRGINPEAARDYIINDMQVLSSGDVLLATNEGLVYYDATEKDYRPYMLNSYLDEQYIKSLLLTDNERFIWMGSDTGLYVQERETGHISRFTEQTGGLPSLTLANRGMSADSENHIWVATSAGIARSAGPLTLPESRRPVLLSTFVNNVNIGRNGNLEANTNTILQFNVASLMYPGDNLRYQMRRGDDGTWEDVETSGTITLSELSLGARELHVRALQSGGYRWSPPLTIPYRVLPPWYFQTEFIILYLALVGLLIFGVTRFYTIRLRKSKAELERIIRLRLKEIKQKNEALLLAKEEADKANRAKSEFLANMSHEIRTPLNGVIGFVDILQASGLNQQQKEYANYVASSANTLMQLINQVLDLSKAEAGRLELDAHTAALDVLCDTTVNIIRVAAGKKKLPVFLYTDPRLPYRVEVDELRLRQVLINLLGNAVKFTESGYVELSVKPVGEQPPEEAEIGPDEKLTQLLRFEVIDTGIGIPADKIASIFNPFSQVDPSTTRKYGGTGLGLSISKSIIEKMGGELRVQSKKNKGSRFYFDVPLKVVKPASGRLPAVFSTKELAGLIVSSCRRHARILSNYLRELKITPVHIAAPEELTEELERSQPDIIVVDGARQTDAKQFRQLLQRVLNHSHASCAVVGISEIDQIVQLQAGSWPSRLRITQMPVRFRALRSSLKQVMQQVQQEKEDTDASADSPEHATGHASGLVQAEAPAEQAITILLVDDNAINLKLAEALLKRCIKQKIIVHTAENGAEAIERFNECRYALILMDIQMPVMDGFAATLRIRELEQQSTAKKTPAVPIVALTAGVSQKERSRCYDAGMNDFISKPISFDKFKSIIHKWIPEKSASFSPDKNVQVNPSILTQDHQLN